MYEEQIQEKAFNRALGAWHRQLNTREERRTQGWDAERMAEDVLAKVEQVLDNLERGDLGWGVPTDVTLDLGMRGGRGLHSVTIHVTTSLVLGKETREQRSRRHIYRELVVGSQPADPTWLDEDDDEDITVVRQPEACEAFLSVAETYGRGEGSTSRALRGLVDAGGLNYLKEEPYGWDDAKVKDLAERLEGYAHDALRPPFEFTRCEMNRAKWAWYSGGWDEDYNLANGSAMRGMMPNLNVCVNVGVEPDPLRDLRKEYVESSGCIVRGVWKRELSEEELAEQRNTHKRINELGGGYEGIMAALDEKATHQTKKCKGIKKGLEKTPQPPFTDAVVQKVLRQSVQRMPRDALRSAIAAGLASGATFLERSKAEKEAKAAARKAKKDARSEKENAQGDHDATAKPAPAAKRKRASGGGGETPKSAARARPGTSSTPLGDATSKRGAN